MQYILIIGNRLIHAPFPSVKAAYGTAAAICAEHGFHGLGTYEWCSRECSNKGAYTCTLSKGDINALLTIEPLKK